LTAKLYHKRIYKVVADSCGPDVKPFCLQYAVDANLIATGEVVK